MPLHRALLIAVAASIAAVAPVTARTQTATAPSPAAARVLAPRGNGPLDFDSLQVGMLARLEASPLISGARSGIIQARIGDTLLVRGVKHHEFVRVPPDSIEWMMVGTGRGTTRRSVMRGALIGTAAGFILASVMQYWIGQDQSPQPRGCPFALTSSCGKSRRLLVSGLGIGMIAGAALGAEAGEERWRIVALP